MLGDTTYFGRTNHRVNYVPFGILQSDRLSHMYIIGKTGVGKSSLLETLAWQDMLAGRGFALIDPHGDLAEDLARDVVRVAPGRLIHFNATDPWMPFGFNPLRRLHDARIPQAASGMLETFKKIWPEAWGVRMEHVLRNTLYALLERDDSTLPDILRLCGDKDFRAKIVKDVRNPVVRAFWTEEFEGYSPRLKADSVAPIQNKMGALLSDPTLFRILVEPKIDLRFRKMMDAGQILIVNVSRGRLGQDSALLLGSLIVSMIGLAAFSRAESSVASRRPFFLYLDEFHNFTTLMLANMMAELRKYGVGLILAHQYLHQLDPDIRHAVLGNAGSLIAFRAGAEDAHYLADELQPKIQVLDILNLENHALYVKLMIEGTPSQPFSGTAMTRTDPFFLRAQPSP